MTDHPQFDSRFQTLLTGFNPDKIANDNGTIYGVWPDFRLAYFNVGWLRFAELNGGGSSIRSEWTLGRCILDSIADPLRQFFVENYQRCLKEGRPWEHLYDCSSSKKYRQYHMTTFPLGNAEGLLIVNSLRLETNHTHAPCRALDELYRDHNGIVHQCCHCRRVRRSRGDLKWDWVPDWVSKIPPKTSHGICPPCEGFHYFGKRQEKYDIVQSFRTDS